MRWALLEVMSMSTRCQTTCFQTSVKTQGGVHIASQKQRRITPRSPLLEMRSPQIHKEIDYFPKVSFVSPDLHFSPGDKMTSVHQSCFERRRGGEGEEVKWPIRLCTASFLGARKRWSWRTCLCADIFQFKVFEVFFISPLSEYNQIK